MAGPRGQPLPLLFSDRRGYLPDPFDHSASEVGITTAARPPRSYSASPARPTPTAQREHIEVSPHVLRHTFLRKLAEKKGVHHAREASGHQSDRYIWRYVKPDQQTLAEAIDDLE